MKLGVVVTVMAAFIFIGPAYMWAGDEALKGLFSQRHIEGAMIISSLDGDVEYIHNKARAEKRFLPASTFKILNALIALDEKAVRGEKEVIPWDGRDRGWSAWNRDHSLETAFPVSCVWFFQRLAERIGNEVYLRHLDRVGYGNRQTGPDVETFWLDGDLRISAREQIAFLKKLYEDKLPYSKHGLEVVKKIMIVERTPDYTIRAKTGWASRIKPQHGWYVGYVENKGGVWFFATNIDITNKEDAGQRRLISMEALKIKGIIGQ